MNDELKNVAVILAAGLLRLRKRRASQVAASLEEALRVKPSAGEEDK